MHLYIQRLDTYGTTLYRVPAHGGDEDDFIYVYDAPENEVQKLQFENTLSQYHPVWVTEESIYYETVDYDVYRYDKASGGGPDGRRV